MFVSRHVRPRSGQQPIQTLEQRNSEPNSGQPTQYDAASVKKVRKLLKASHSIFTRFLGVTVKTVQSWEQGQSTPSDMARRFLDEIRADRDYWLKRLRRWFQPTKLN